MKKRGGARACAGAHAASQPKVQVNRGSSANAAVRALPQRAYVRARSLRCREAHANRAMRARQRVVKPGKCRLPVSVGNGRQESCGSGEVGHAIHSEPRAPHRGLRGGAPSGRGGDGRLLDANYPREVAYPERPRQ